MVLLVFLSCHCLVSHVVAAWWCLLVGGLFALVPGAAAARALIDVEELSAMEIAEKAMAIAADMCVYTNDNFVKDSLP